MAPTATVPSLAETAVPSPTSTAIALAPAPTLVPSPTPLDPRQEEFERANKMLRSGEIDEAVRELRRLVKKHDEFAYGHFFLAAAYAVQGEDGRAGAELTRYLALEPAGRFIGKAKATLANCE